MPASTSQPSAAQVQAINAAMSDINGLVKFASEDWIKQLPGLLQPDELPEKMLMVDYKGNPDTLMIVTNHRVMFISQRAFSLTKIKVRDFPCYELTKVDFSPGMLKHRITMHRGRKKEELHGQVLEGKDRARLMAEHLATKVAGGDGSIAKDAKTAKRFALDQLARDSGVVTSIGGYAGVLQHLAGLLDEDEMPHSLFMATYDDRKGLNISSATLETGVLALTDDRLVHVAKPPMSKARVVSIPYEDIERLTYTKGMMFGSVSAWVDGVEEKFDKLGRSDGEQVAHALEGIIG
jgi:hypothetical protein